MSAAWEGELELEFAKKNLTTQLLEVILLHLVKFSDRLSYSC